MSTNGIGTLQEKSLHAAVKEWYAGPSDLLEEEVAGFVVDIVRGDELIEVQTGGFAPLKRKLERLTAAAHRVRLVRPIAAVKWILRVEADGETRIGRRKSPKRGRPEHVFEQLVSIPELVRRDNFSLEVLLIHEEEVRCYDGNGSWRHPEWRRYDRRLIEVVERRTLTAPADFLAFLPPDLERPFTNRQLAEAGGYRLALAGKMTYCLHRMGALRMVGKQRNAQLFSEAECARAAD